MKLTNKKILITGGASGYGLELAKQLINKGNKVIICGRDEIKLFAAKEQLQEIEIFVCDISKTEERKKLYAFIKNKHEDLNVLINNAAIVYSFNFWKDSNALQFLQSEMETNYIAPLALSKSLWPYLENKKKSAIINISTGLVLSPKAKYPGYCASKAALHSASQTLRMQNKQEKVKIIEVLLPVVDTPFHKGKTPKKAISTKKAVQYSIKGIEKGRSEVKVGMVKKMAILIKVMPRLISKKVNTM